MSNGIVVVGAGLAGAKAAETLREEGYDGRVVVVGEEPERPYERPPLSKEYLAGTAEREAAFVHPEGWYGEHDVELLLGRRATALDPGGHSVHLDDGTDLRFDKLLLATGASSRRLRGEAFPPELSGVHYLRTRADSDALRAALEDGGRRVAVVGSGWIGLEVAAAARGYGDDVTVLGQESVPLEAALGPELGAVFGDLHREHGVDLRPGTKVTGFDSRDGRVTGVRLGDGDVVPADVVVVGIGAVPNVDLARDAGLEVGNGVHVDARLRTSHPDIYAVGDVAAVARDGGRLHVEHWANALNAGPVAARSMLGQDVTDDLVPYFFTDQYDLGMEYSGFPGRTPTTQVVFRGDVPGREFVAFWVDGGRVLAGMAVNVWDTVGEIERLVRSGERVDPARLADADVPLTGLAA